MRRPAVAFPSLRSQPTPPDAYLPVNLVRTDGGPRSLLRAARVDTVPGVSKLATDETSAAAIPRPPYDKAATTLRHAKLLYSTHSYEQVVGKMTASVVGVVAAKARGGTCGRPHTVDNTRSRAPWKLSAARPPVSSLQLDVDRTVSARPPVSAAPSAPAPHLTLPVIAPVRYRELVNPPYVDPVAMEGERGLTAFDHP